MVVGARQSFITIKTVTHKYFSEKKKLYLCFTDFRKAYDSIWIKALSYKLSAYSTGTNFVKLLENMYNKSWLQEDVTFHEVTNIESLTTMHGLQLVSDPTLCFPIHHHV